MKTNKSILGDPSEAQEQSALVHLLDVTYPTLKYRVGMESGKRNPLIAKKQGVSSGWSDFHFPYARKGKIGLWIELKKKGEKLFKADGITPKDKRIKNQIETGSFLVKQNHEFHFAFGAEEAFKIVRNYFLEERP
ncbi:hypothetical protein [Leptospira bouyouniensis]|uniref:VRR-NUC domain-containing protein n=1 Tax=Leptospira bouyouniensis TaxID=2484911 RepID=A0ABY2L332_9LEPT|nr:hypothetical protein [Leptospira bouyouniensis]TGK45550.1 hypothetical protein EHQ10_19065 [Leptospira bouyouniensis]